MYLYELVKKYPHKKYKNKNIPYTYFRFSTLLDSIYAYNEDYNIEFVNYNYHSFWKRVTLNEWELYKEKPKYTHEFIMNGWLVYGNDANKYVRVASYYEGLYVYDIPLPYISHKQFRFDDIQKETIVKDVPK